MNDMTAVRRAVDRLLSGSLVALLDLLAEDVELEVAGGGDQPGCWKDSGKQAVVEYFTPLRGLVAFWHLDYSTRGGQVIAWGKESFTVQGCGVEGGSEFALVFELDEGMITRFLVIEDLAAYMHDRSTLGETASAAAWEGAPSGSDWERGSQLASRAQFLSA